MSYRTCMKSEKQKIRVYRLLQEGGYLVEAG